MPNVVVGLVGLVTVPILLFLAWRGCRKVFGLIFPPGATDYAFQLFFYSFSTGSELRSWRCRCL
jgi:hypothetical protein